MACSAGQDWGTEALAKIPGTSSGLVAVKICREGHLTVAAETDVSNTAKVWCCKEQYYIATWNVRSMNQGKLEVVKQEMARVNIDILGIHELKWAGMGEFNSDGHYIYYCGQ